MSRWTRLGSVALLAAAMSWAGLGAAPASAAPLGSCSTTRGTIIAVDFGHWSGPIIRGCGVQADGQPDSSPYALLADGGFTTAGTAHDGPALVCRIGNAAFRGGTQYPTPAEDHCVVTPPASAYWSYWLAASGATTWTYATMTQPAPVGGVAYWEFGSGQTPSSSLIDQLRAHNVTAAAGSPSSAQAAAPRAASSRATPRAATTHPPGPTGSVAATGSSAAGTDPATPGTSTAGPLASHSTGTPQPRVVASVAPTGHGAGSAVPVVVTVVIVAALGAAGGVSLVRRRRREQS